MNEQYISRQIAVYKTDKKLVELLDKLNLAPLDTYAHMHAQGDEDGNGKRTYSNIGIILQDYSAGTGANTKRVTGNLSPAEVQYIFSRVQNGVSKFDFRTDKIFGAPDENGYASVTKLCIKRADVGSDGKSRNYPWYIEIENGKGIPQKTQIGGTYCQPNSYIAETKVYANINDLDFFKLFSRAVSYIQAWELTHAPAIIRQARKQIEENTQAQYA